MVKAGWRYVSTIQSKDFSSMSGQKAIIHREAAGRAGELELI